MIVKGNTVVVILWTSFKMAAIGQQNIPWPGLHQMISITLYNDKPYGAIWAFQPPGTGTAILVARPSSRRSSSDCPRQRS